MESAIEITDVLAADLKAQYKLEITPSDNLVEDNFTLGYMPLYKV